MNIGKSSTKNTRSMITKLLLGLAYAAVILGVSMGSALAEDEHHDGKEGKHDNRKHDERERHDDRNWHRDGGYYYAPPPPVYAPPPVYYSPPEYYSSPGISIVLPLNFR